MISGAHFIIYSRNSEKDRDFFRDVLKFTNVDVGHGWLIFGLPPSEVAVHPAYENSVNEFFLLCEDIEKFMQEMGNHGIACGLVQDQRWGRLTSLTLPGGGELKVYQPKHQRPEPLTQMVI